MDTKPQIAIVGTEGSGKTVLASVLAKRMSSNTDGTFLHPQGWETAEYVEKVWNSLNNGEWWKSTEAGMAFELQWTLHIGQESFPLKLIDSAGQDLRELFSKDTHKKENLSGFQRELLEYIQTASVVIITVNLLHFRGEPDGLKRKQNEFVLKEIVDMFVAGKKHQDIALVFTAWDLYDADITGNYGDFTNYLKKELPQLYNAVHIGHQSGDSIRWFPVAAVMDTEVRDNIRVPKPEFRSKGLDELNQWFINHFQEEQKKEQNRILTEIQAKKHEIKMRKIIPTTVGGIFGGGIVAGTTVGGIVGGIVPGIMDTLIMVGCGVVVGAIGGLLLDKLDKNEKAKSEEKTEQEQLKNQEKTEQTGDVGNGKRREHADTSNTGKEMDTVSAIPPSERKSKSMKFD